MDTELMSAYPETGPCGIDYGWLLCIVCPLSFVIAIACRPNAVRDAAELENREQRDPWMDLPGSNSVTNGVVNIRQDEMDSRIKEGN